MKDFSYAGFIRLVMFLLMALTPLQAHANEPVEVSRQITATEGGELEITNAVGDIVRLKIPPDALSDTGEIRLVANATPPASPLSLTSSGVSIHPQELVFQKPVLLQIQTVAPLPQGAMVFRVASPELVIPMGDSRSLEIAQDPEEKAVELDTKSSALSGDSGGHENEVFRGGTFITGVPSKQEAREQSKMLIDMPPPGYPDWQGAKEQIRGILEWAERDMLVGDDAAAESLMDRARDIAGKVIREFLEVPEPSNPCDESYYQLMFQLAELSMLGLTHDMPEADVEFQRRIQRAMNLCLGIAAAFMPDCKVSSPGKELTLSLKANVFDEVPALRKYSRLVVCATQGRITNGTQWSAGGNCRVFPIDSGDLKLQYKAPGKCDVSDLVQAYSSYDTLPVAEKPLADTGIIKVIADMEVKTICEPSNILLESRYRSAPGSYGYSERVEDIPLALDFSSDPPSASGDTISLWHEHAECTTTLRSPVKVQGSLVCKKGEKTIMKLMRDQHEQKQRSCCTHSNGERCSGIDFDMHFPFWSGFGGMFSPCQGKGIEQEGSYMLIELRDGSSFECISEEGVTSSLRLRMGTRVE